MNSILITEKQNKISDHIDQQNIYQILEMINKEDENVSIAVNKAIPKIEKFIKDTIKQFANSGRLFYVGAGTSGRLGVLDASECPPTFRTEPDMVQGIIAGGDKALRQSIEGAEDSEKYGRKSITDKSINKNDIVLGISANGNAPFIHGALIEAKSRGAITGLFLCNSAIEKDYIDHVISVIVGPEVIAGSTRMKAGTATKLVLNMITTTTMIKLNKTYGNLMVDLTACNQKLWDRGTRLVRQITKLGYKNSLELLQSADGEVKTAVVMFYKSIDKESSRLLINQVDGNLRELIC